MKTHRKLDVFTSFNKVKRTIESVIHEKQIDACINMMKLHGKNHEPKGLEQLSDMIIKKSREVAIDLPH